MSYEDTIVKTLLAFGVLLVGAVAGWNLPPIVWIVGAIVGFVLALVNTFKKKPSPGLVLAYAFFEGLFVGGISAAFNTMSDGIVAQAVCSARSVSSPSRCCSSRAARSVRRRRRPGSSSSRWSGTWSSRS